MVFLHITHPSAAQHSRNIIGMVDVTRCREDVAALNTHAKRAHKSFPMALYWLLSLCFLHFSVCLFVCVCLSIGLFVCASPYGCPFSCLSVCVYLFLYSSIHLPFVSRRCLVRATDACTHARAHMGHVSRNATTGHPCTCTHQTFYASHFFITRSLGLSAWRRISKHIDRMVAQLGA
jgi:hypothetical protein